MTEMPEITPGEARLLEELAELYESDPEGYQALIRDLGTDASGAEDDPARSHGEFILGVTQDAERQRRERDKALLSAIFTAARDQDQEGGQE